MGKETETETKKNHSREDKHFSGSWYRDGTKLRLPTGAPQTLTGKLWDERARFYREYQRKQRNKKINAAITMAMVIIGASYLIFSFGVRI
tara:strand:- start:452 stop:721 length:270 start_codon:yes stop_codon:yes gene_type:complete